MALRECDGSSTAGGAPAVAMAAIARAAASAFASRPPREWGREGVSEGVGEWDGDMETVVARLSTLKAGEGAETATS